MGYLGVHFALNENDIAELRAILDDEERREYLSEVIEEREYRGPHAVETDKAWDPIHRCFAEGTLNWSLGTYPLNHVILGGESLYEGEGYIMSLKTPEQVRAIAAEIGTITRSDMAKRFRRINPETFRFPINDEVEQYTWNWFTDLVPFYQMAAREGLSVLFTADT